MICKIKVYKELIRALALFYLIWFFTILQAIVNFCLSVRRQIRCCNPHRFYKSRDSPFLCWETVFCIQHLHCSLSLLGTPFLSVQKILTKVIKEQIFRRKAIISCVSLGEQEELNSGLLKIIVILQQNVFSERHESKILTFYFPLPFSAGSSWKSFVNKFFASALLKLAVWAWVRKAERILCLLPRWLKQSWGSSSTAVRSFCMSWVICWLLQRKRRVHPAKRSTTQTKPFFCLSQSIVHRFVDSGSFSLCLVIPAGFSMVIIGSRLRRVLIVAWQTLNFKRREIKERKQSPSNVFPDCWERVWCACSKLDWGAGGGSVYAVTAFLWINTWLGKVMSFTQDSLCQS